MNKKNVEWRRKGIDSFNLNVSQTDVQDLVDFEVMTFVNIYLQPTYMYILPCIKSSLSQKALPTKSG